MASRLSFFFHLKHTSLTCLTDIHCVPTEMAKTEISLTDMKDFPIPKFCFFKSKQSVLPHWPTDMKVKVCTSGDCLVT